MIGRWRRRRALAALAALPALHWPDRHHVTNLRPVPPRLVDWQAEGWA